MGHWKTQRSNNLRFSGKPGIFGMCERDARRFLQGVRGSRQIRTGRSARGRWFRCSGRITRHSYGGHSAGRRATTPRVAGDRLGTQIVPAVFWALIISPAMVSNAVPDPVRIGQTQLMSSAVPAPIQALLPGGALLSGIVWQQESIRKSLLTRLSQ